MTPEELVTVKYALVCAWTAAAKNEPISARISDQMLGAILLINEKLKFQKAGEVLQITL